MTVLGKTRSSEWHSVTIADTEVEFHVEGSGRKLVLIDGSFGFRPDGPFIADLSERFTVTALRLPGFGDKALPGWITSIDDFAYLVLQTLAALDLRDAVLIGSSLGGWVAAEVAAMNASRLSALVLVDPFGLKAGAIDRLDVPDVYAMSRSKLDTLLYADPERYRFDGGSGDDKTLERMARGWETMALVCWDTFFHNPKLKYRLAGIDLPTLLLRGEADGLVSRANTQAFASLIKGAAFAEIGVSGHLPLIENAEETVARIASFVEG